MKFYSTLLLFLLCFTLHAQTDINTNRLSEALLNRLDEQPNGWHEVLIMLEDKVDVVQMDKDFYARRASLEERTFELITALKQKVATTQPVLLNLLENSNEVNQNSIRSFYITNLIYAEMTTAMIAELSQHHAVDYLDINGKTELVEYECVDAPTAAPPVPNGTEAGLRAIDAPELWAMGYTGYGRIGYTSDTGVEPSHPQLLYKYRGMYAPASESWYEFDNSTSYPAECDEHGTHVTGTMMGLDRSERDTIGVAYNALWIGQASIVCNDFGTIDNIAGFEWALDPDNDANTIDDMPDAINNSWRDPSQSGNPCNNPYVDILNALEITKVAVVFSAGNEGPEPSTMTTPHNLNMSLVNTFTIGAVDGNSSFLPIADFSSRGPSVCNTNNMDSSIVIKPEVCAPGVSVRSCVPGGYDNFQGTSMAAPHVAGAIILLREAFPMTTATEIKLALYFSAIDLGQPGEDNDYGMGIINLPAAFQYLLDEGFTPVAPITRTLDLVLVNVQTYSSFCNDNLNFEMVVENGGDETINSFEVAYGAANVNEMYTWNGTLEAGERTTISLEMNGINGGNTELEIELSNPNGMEDPRPLNNRYQVPITIENFEPLNAFIEGSEVLCETATALVRAEYLGVGTADVTWYDALFEGNELGTGTTLEVGPISEPTTVFADAVYNVSAGKIDLGNEPQDITGPVEDLDIGLRFDALVDLKIKSVKVYFDNPGFRQIKIDNSEGNNVATITRNMTSPSGVEEFVLNVDVPAGQNYIMSLTLGPPLKINTDNADYPYLFDDVIRIERATGVNNIDALKKYHFFYDWNIELKDPCGRVPLHLDIMPDAGTLPTVDFTPSTQVVNLDTDSGLVDFSNNSQNATTYSWNFGDGNTSTDSAPTHTYTQAGEYEVSLIATNAEGCEAHQVQLIQVSGAIPSAVENILAAEEINLFPNPTTDNLTIAFDFAAQQTLTYQLVDVLGRPVMPLQKGSFGNTTRAISLQHLPTGIYYLQINIEGKQAVRKVMKL